MLRPISLDSAPVSEIIEKVWLNIDAKRLEYRILHAYTKVYRPLRTRTDAALLGERRIGRDGERARKLAVHRQLKCHAARGVCVEASNVPDAVSQP